MGVSEEGKSKSNPLKIMAHTALAIVALAHAKGSKREYFED